MHTDPAPTAPVVRKGTVYVGNKVIGSVSPGATSGKFCAAFGGKALGKHYARRTDAVQALMANAKRCNII